MLNFQTWKRIIKKCYKFCFNLYLNIGNFILKNLKCCSRNYVQRERSFARRRGAEGITGTENSTRENVLAMEEDYFVNIGARSKFSDEVNIN